MKQYILGMTFSLVVAMMVGACGGSSGTAAATAEGTASVDALSTVPTMDLSQYDTSTSGNANLSAMLSKSFSKAKSAQSGYKGLGQKLHEVGGTSRAGCEANMHKQEMIRMSQQIQLDRCYPEAMETAGFIEIPSGSYNLYSIAPPANENPGEFCDDIPDEFEDEKEGCLAEATEQRDMRMRIGIIDGALHVDMCNGETLNSEATYSASGSEYTGAVVRIGQWSGKEEKGSFSIVVDAESVVDGIVTLGDSGSALAEGKMSGGFGKGNMSFEAIGSDSSNRVKGAFAGSFTDPFTQKATTFTGKVYSRFGGVTHTGTAKFSFTGSVPPMRVQDMIPSGMGADQLNNFLQSFGAELGIELTEDNYQTTYLCPNPLFNPEEPSNTVKPMTVLDGDSCPSVTHTGIESFAITNGEITEGFGTKKVQAFTLIADADSAYFDEVDAFVIADLVATVSDSDIAFSRNWDCSGTFVPIAFDDFTPAQFAAAESAMQKCFEIEEKARGNEGMGGHNCAEQENQNDVNDFAENGPSFGLYGGDLTYQNGCGGGETIPHKMFINSINPEDDEYCLPSEGSCEDFNVVANEADAEDLPIEFGSEGSGINITAMAYTQAGDAAATAVAITFDAPLSCTANYTISQPTFDGPQAFGEGDGQFIPQACIDAGLTTEAACRQLCEDHNVNCSE